MAKYTLKEAQSGFNPSTLSNEAYFTQAEFYGKWYEQQGKRVFRYEIVENGQTVGYFQAIRHDLVFGKHYIYIPLGPVLSTKSDQLIEFIKTELKTLAKSQDAMFVRFDFCPTQDETVLSKYFLKAPKYSYKSSYFHPREEWFLDLTQTQEEIFLAMDKKTRYSIKLSEKRQIKTEIVETNFEKYLDKFVQLMEETADRKSISAHTKQHYSNVFKYLPGNGFLVVAKYKNEILTINLFITFNGVANHVFGGNSSKERVRQPSYAAQRAGIIHSKNQGLEQYNFGGISTDLSNKNWQGMTKFKMKFGGYPIVHSDFYDLVTSKTWYYLYLLRKKLKN